MPSEVSTINGDQSVQELRRELAEAREQQAATAEILAAISNSPTDAHRVFAEIAASAARLCDADDGTIYQVAGDFLHPVAHHGSIPQSGTLPLTRGYITGRVVLDRRTIHVADMQAETNDYPESSDFARRLGHRTILAVPLIRAGAAIGAVNIRRTEVRPFTDRQIQLLKTFADQAVIAIENTRLFEAEQASKRELQEALEYQTATSDVLNVISRSPSQLQPVFDFIARSASRLCGDEHAIVTRYDGELLHLAAQHNPRPGIADEQARFYPRVPQRETSISGRALVDATVVHVPDLDNEEFDPSAREGYRRMGLRAAVAVPMMHDGRPIGVIGVSRGMPGVFSDRQIELLRTFADQAVIAVENVRLFEEIAQKSRELEIASQHKSQFVANMSHELRTPLAAILGYAELMQEGFYEPQGKKSLDALTRIRSNGKHLLGLINTVLDIAKIESGQFSLNLAEYAIETVVETVRAATESLAETKKLALKTDVAKRLPVGVGDEQRLTQVLLNLVGNAIKFTDAGEVRIAAGTANGHFTVSVSDTGPGIPTEEYERIFEKFRQVDSSNTRAKGGTGLGLAIAREIVAMHGGRIWVESTIGQGSTFRMELPVRAAADAGGA